MYVGAPLGEKQSGRRQAQRLGLQGLLLFQHLRDRNGHMMGRQKVNMRKRCNSHSHQIRSDLSSTQLQRHLQCKTQVLGMINSTDRPNLKQNVSIKRLEAIIMPSIIITQIVVKARQSTVMPAIQSLHSWLMLH